MFAKFLIPQKKNKKTLVSVLVAYGPTKCIYNCTTMMKSNYLFLEDC